MLLLSLVHFSCNADESTTSTQATAKASTTASSLKSATTFFAHYLDSYNAYDAEAAAAKYADNIVLTGAADLALTVPREQMKNNISRFLGNLKSKGVVRFEWQTLQVKMLSKNIALASNVAVRYLKDGSEYNRAGATVFAQQNNGAWEIIMINLHSPENALPLT